MYSAGETCRTLNPKYMTPYHVQTQWAEITELKGLIGEFHDELKRPLTIFDIGIGYARVPVWLSQVPTWNKIVKYVGIDNSPNCVVKSRRIIREAKIDDKVEVNEFDAVRLGTNSVRFSKDKFDLVICTYFTAGDLKPDEIELETKEDGSIVDYDIDALRPNKVFVSVFKGIYDLLRDGGRIVLGSIYLNNDRTRLTQENFYKRCGMTVITSAKDLFVATKEGFWSERFDKHRICSYLSWIPVNNIGFIPLDDYDFATMVVIRK